MNVIQEWLEGNQDFETGRKLYEKYGRNRSLKLRFQKFGADGYNTSVLLSELDQLQHWSGIQDVTTQEAEAQTVGEKREPSPSETVTVEKVPEEAPRKAEPTIDEISQNIKTILAGVKSSQRNATVEELNQQVKTIKAAADIEKHKKIRGNYHNQLMKRANKLTDQSLSVAEAKELIDEGLYLRGKIREQTDKMWKNNPTPKAAAPKPHRGDPDKVDFASIETAKECNRQLNNARKRRTQARNAIKKHLGTQKGTSWKAIQKVLKGKTTLPPKVIKYIALEEKRDKLIGELNDRLDTITKRSA